MDKRVSSFLKYSILAAAVPLIIAVFAVAAQRSLSLSAFAKSMTVLAVVMISLALVVAVMLLLVYSAYKNKQVRPFAAKYTRLSLKVLTPLAELLAGIVGKDKNDIRSVFIEINNIIVKSSKKLYKPDEVLVILPHCLQNSDCQYKITYDTSNCHRCGKCTIGSILAIAEEKGVRTIVVTGGTAARNAVSGKKPKVLLSVACERDLASGIQDVGSIPVIGVLNSRPNGPCINTSVDVGTLGIELDKLLKSEKKEAAGGYDC